MSKKSGGKQSALQRLSNNMNSMLANTGTKRRKLSPSVKQASCKKLKLKPDPTRLFKRFKFDIDEKENRDDPLNSITGTLKSDNQKPKTVLKTWTPPLKINSNSEKIFDKLQNTERSIGISNKAKSEISKRKVPSATVTRASRENVDVSDENSDGTSELFYDIKEIDKINKNKNHQDCPADKLNVLSEYDSMTKEDSFDKGNDVQELNTTADISIELLHDTAYNFNIPEDNPEDKDQQATESNNCNEAINKYKSEILLSYYDSDKKLDYVTNDDYNSTNTNLNEIFINKVSPNKNTDTIQNSEDNENVFLMKATQLKSENIIHQDIINEVDDVKVQNNDKIKKSIVNLNKNYPELEFTPENNKPDEKIFYTFNDIISPQNLQSNSQIISINGNQIEKENNFIPDKDMNDSEFNNKSQKPISSDNEHNIQKSDDEEFFLTCANDNMNLNPNLETNHEKISLEKKKLNSKNRKTCNNDKLIVSEFNICEKEKKASGITPEDEEFFLTCVNDNINLNANLGTDHEKASLEQNNLNSQYKKTCDNDKLIVNEFTVYDKEKKGSDIRTEINSMIVKKDTDSLKNYEIQGNSVMEHDSQCISHDKIFTSSVLLHENLDKNSSKDTKIIDIINHTLKSDNNEKYNQLTNDTISLVPEYNDINENINKSQFKNFKSVGKEDEIIETREEEACTVHETIPSDINKIQNNTDPFDNEIRSEEGQIISSESDNDKDSQETILQINDDSREANIKELINNKVDKLIIDENIEVCDNDLSKDKFSGINSDKDKIIEEKYEEVGIYNKYNTIHSITNNNLKNHSIRNNHYDDSQPEECQIISLDSDESKNSQESCFEVINDNENEQKIDEVIKIEEIKKEKYDDLIECSDDFYDIPMSEVIRIENEYTETKMNFSKQTNENIYQTFNRSNISSTSNANMANNSKNLITVNKNMKSVDNHEPIIPPLKLEWVQKMNEEKQKLRSIIQEINKLNNIVLQARKELWPRQFNNQ